MAASAGRGHKIMKVVSRIILIVSGLAVALVLTGALIFASVNKTNGEISSSGETREYILYVPESLDSGAPVPLVLSFHGFAEWPALHRQVSGWDRLADEYGFIVVYPEGTDFPLRWRTFLSRDTAAEAREDVVFISDLIDSLSERYLIDPDRIYADGLSNGAGMSTLLACELSDQIAAVGGVAGAYITPLENCTPSRPVPLIVFHGTEDPIVPFEGGPSHSFDLPFPAIPDFVAGWAASNGCADQPDTLPAQEEASGITYTDCDQGADVVFYTIEGGGHSWPGGEPLPESIVGLTSDAISATDLIWAFFQQHPLAR